MRVTKKIRDIANKIADNARKQRRLTNQLTAELEKQGFDIDDKDVIWAWGFLEGDCSAEPLLGILEDM